MIVLIYPILDYKINKIRNYLFIDKIEFVLKANT